MPDGMKCFIHLHGCLATMLLFYTTQSLNDALLVSCFLLIHYDVLITYCMSFMHALSCAWHCSLDDSANYLMIGLNLWSPILFHAWLFSRITERVTGLVKQK